MSSRRYDNKNRQYSTSSGGTTTTSSTDSSYSSSEGEERMYMHAAHLEDYASAVAGTQMDHEKNSLAGISLAGILCSTTGTSTSNNTNDNSAKNLSSLEEALPRMQAYVHKFESHQPMGTLVDTGVQTKQQQEGLVHASTLSKQQLEAVHHNAQSLLAKRTDLVELSKLPFEKQLELHTRQSGELKSFSSLGASQQEQVKLNSQKSARMDEHRELSEKSGLAVLCHAVKLNSGNDLKQTPLLDNSASILRQKGAFDLSFAASIQDAQLRTMFEGKPLECTTNKQHQAEAELILAHLHRHHRHYCDLVEVGGLKTYMCDVVHRTGQDYLMLIPTKRYLDALGMEANKTRAIKIVGSHLALFDRKAAAPVLNNMGDRAAYDYQSALYGHRIVLRRLDAETIEVNGAWIAHRDSVGGGHLYVMKDVSPRQLLAEEKRAARHQHQALVQEPRLIDLDNDPDLNLDYVTVDEELSARPTELMQPVSHIGSYREPKMSVLLNKMLQPNYNCVTDMKSYLSFATTTNGLLSLAASTATSSAAQCTDLHIKLFDLNDAFNRHLVNALSPLEYMRVVDTRVLAGTQAQQLELGDQLSVHEYKVSAALDQPLRKSDFLNHVAVLSFVRGDEVLLTSFAVHDEPYSRDVYMSPSEGVVLRFKDNLLDCVALNPASQAFAAQAHEGDSVRVNESVALRLAVDKQLSNQLEAHEHTFEQFADLVVPLCAPSFLKRAKAALKGAVTHSVLLTPNAQPLSTDNDEPEGPEATKRLMAMIGKNAVLAAKNKHSYTAQRQTYHSRTRPSDYIDVYTFDNTVNKKPLSFAALVDKKGRPLVLSLTVPNPITQKPQQVTFKLSNTKNIASQSGWEGSKAGLTFHFETEGGNVERLAIEYQKASAGGSGRRAAKLPEPLPSQAGGDDVASQVTAFLTDEAYKLHSLSLPVSNAFLQVRMRALLAGVHLSDHSPALRFFGALHDSLKSHPVDAPVLGAASLLKTALTDTQNSVMSKNQYASPTNDAIQRCTALFEAVNFSQLDASRTLDQVLDYASSKSLGLADRQLYVSRFACILQEVLTVLKK